MINQLLLGLVNSTLRQKGIPKIKGNYAYTCPFCNHYKKKLEVNLEENSTGYNPWHCWVCDKKGTKIISLFKAVNASSTNISELSKYVKVRKTEVSYTNTYKDDLKLPDEFVPLYNCDTSKLEARQALKYLRERGLTPYDYIKYNIGYCAEGEYKGRVVVPSYDANNSINFYVGRSFTEASFYKYKLPSVTRNIIPFENTINWNLPIILCEGVFDAIAIKRNVIPLLGKALSKQLKQKLLSPVVKDIYIVLDKDAMKEALRHCENFINEGKNVYLIHLSDKDPSDMGFVEFTNMIQKSEKLTFSKLIYEKLNL